MGETATVTEETKDEPTVETVWVIGTVEAGGKTGEVPDPPMTHGCGVREEGRGRISCSGTTIR